MVLDDALLHENMAHFDTEYQRLEASYNDSPPGEEDLMVHVAEGSKCEYD